MIETTILNYLTTALTNVGVCMEEPDNTNPPYIVIKKTGSGRDNFINQATVAIQSYGSTLYNAANLNEQVKTAMFNLPGNSDVSACFLNSDYNFTDTAKKKYRYQAVFDLIYI